jgi:hypothetical protein
MSQSSEQQPPQQIPDQDTNETDPEVAKALAELFEILLAE